MSAQLFNFEMFIPMTVFVTSLLASAHCVGMCGPLILNITKTKSGLVYYHFGRFLSYASLGGIAGYFGEQIAKIAEYPVINLVALTLFTLLICYSALQFLRGKRFHMKAPMTLQKLLILPYRRGFPVPLIPFTSGLLTIFLPCGHLYTFALGAAATGTALKGAAFMTLFWTGTLPALGFGLGLLRSLFQRYVHFPMAKVLLVVFGVLSIISFTRSVYAFENMLSKRNKTFSENNASQSPATLMNHCGE